MDFVVNRLKEIGLENIKVERFRSDGFIKYLGWRSPVGWRVRSAKLWMVKPAWELVADYSSIAVSLMSYSNGGSVEAEVVYAGEGKTDEDYKDGERYLMDVAPDDALDWQDDFDEYSEMPVMITEPRPGATVSQDVAIEGTCDPFYEMESVEIQLDSQSASGWVMTSTSDNWETWSYSWDTTELVDGKHILHARGYDGSEYHFDSITVYVDQSN